MKKTFMTVLFGLSMVMALALIPCNAMADNIQWHSFDKGLDAGKQQNKKIFLHFYADWCGFCKIMEKKTFHDASVVDYMNKYFIPIKVNTDKKRKLARKFGVRGLPTNWFLTETGERIGARPGYIPPKDFIGFLKFINTNSYKKMSLKEFMSKSQ